MQKITLGKSALLGLCFVVGTAASVASAGEMWKLDDSHSTVGFKVRHLMVTNVSGKFTGVQGTFDVDPKDFTKSKIEGTIDAKTVNTDNAKRDEHLRNEDFFDVGKYPTITFKSKSIAKAGDKFKIKGDLTMHGVTKEITLDAEALTPTIKDPWGNTKRGFSATGKINRQDWGLKWNKTLDAGGVAVGDEVTLMLDFELVADATGAKKS